MKFKVGDFVKAKTETNNFVKKALGNKIHRVTNVRKNSIEVNSIHFTLFNYEIKKVNYLQTKLGKILYK
jgi:hypothetical protein